MIRCGILSDSFMKAKIKLSYIDEYIKNIPPDLRDLFNYK